MRAYVLAFCLVILGLFSVGTAHARGAGEEQAIAEIVSYFDKIAGQAGLTQNTAKDFRNPVASMLEYIPADQNVDAWTRMMTVNITMMSPDSAAQQQTMNGYIQSMKNAYSSHGKILSERMFTSRSGLPVWYVEYTIGEGSSQEFAAGVYGRHGDTLSAFIQAQARGHELPQDDREYIRRLAEMLIER